MTSPRQVIIRESFTARIRSQVWGINGRRTGVEAVVSFATLYWVLSTEYSVAVFTDAIRLFLNPIRQIPLGIQRQRTGLFDDRQIGPFAGFVQVGDAAL